MVYNWIDLLQRALYPAVCALCGAPAEADIDLCRACRDELPHNHNGCRRCALPLPAAAERSICGNCRDQPPPFERCLSPLLYRPPLDRLIAGLKFHGQLRYGRLLGELLADYLQRARPPAPQLIIPVPLHPSRLRQRGYNQALEIARPLSCRLRIPLAYRICARQRATPAQAELEKDQRQRNIRGAFVSSAAIHARHVALVDDVLTTGATAGELARLLKSKGVERVELWAVARTP